jgi:hypothetical protein
MGLGCAEQPAAAPAPDLAEAPLPDMAAPPDLGPAQNGPWLVYEAGLEVGVFDAPTPSTISDSKIHVVRIDPAHFTFKLIAAGELGVDPETLPNWVKDQGLVGGINASMYDANFDTSVFYMRDGAYLNNATWNPNGGAVFATGARGGSAPAVQIIDRTCQDLPTLDPTYDTLVRNYRMIDCARAPTFTQSTKIYSIASVGTDSMGRVLLIHCRSPYSIRDLSVMLLMLPLDLQRLMYVEGGPEASLYVRLGEDAVVSRMGSFETGFREDDTNQRFWAIPNVIGFARK